jgi:hypothetical protein
MCATAIREGLLNINMHYTLGVRALEKKESLVIGAASALVIYTLALVTLGPIVSSALTNTTISNSGSVGAVGVGVYWDQACTNSVTSIDWGVVEPGTNVDKTVYIKNEDNSAVTLSLTTSNWNPPNASNYMTLSWSYEGQSVSAADVIQVVLTLSVSANISGITSFSFDITVTANG